MGTAPRESGAENEMTRVYGVRRVDTDDCGGISSRTLVEGLPTYDKARSACAKLKRAHRSLPTDGATVRYYVFEEAR